MWEFIVNEAQAELFVANHLWPLNVKRDEKGKIVSFIWAGYKFKVSHNLPTNDLYAFDKEAVGLIDLKDG